MPVILLVNFLCTVYICVISFFEVGDHTGLLYSSMGLTYVIKALTNWLRSFDVKQRWIKLARWWPFGAIVAMWSAKRSRESTTTPRSDTLSIHRAEDIVKLLSRPGSPIILVFFDSERRYQIPRVTPSEGRKIHGSGKILPFSTEITVYLGNGTR